jgi:beta-phosphoglucomutase-like phosphatase (HAD superfamily)
MSEVKAVLFDMDGVLIDAREWHYEALNEALGIFGLSISHDDHLDRFNGLSTTTKLKMLSQERNLPYELHEMIAAVKQDRTLRIAAKNCFPNVSHQILISRLRSLNIRVGLVTNSIRQTTEFMLEYAGILKFLDVVITNEDVMEGKPSPEGYLKAMAMLDVRPDETLIVEDGEYGIVAARASGAKVLVVKEPADVGLELLIPEVKGLR